MDDITSQWIRNESDARAAAAGYRFDLERAAFVVWWIERYCRLYEGEWAGEPLTLRGCHDEVFGIPIEGEFYQPDGKTLTQCGDDSIERAMIYAERFAAGEPVDWQYECTMRVHGWLKFSKRWGREIRRFRKSAVFVAKKNKKSPTEAAWSLYHTCGDGEQGQKCFWGAADGKQAGIVAEHAINMVNASPDLASQCSVNLNLRRITHLPSRSFAEPLSSATGKTQKAKEGLNGSLFVDEAHVVDRAFMDRVSRMGISRSEPIMAIFSTAGNDPESWGKEQRDYGADVAAGKIDDPAYFFAEYAAPADMTDGQLDADPVRFGRMANPAWDHTVGEDEYLADYRESSRTVSALATFKMYRLNVWQKTSNPWKITDRWAACRSDRKITDFLGEPCWLGADLSRARDMSALVATFRDESGDRPHYYQFAWAWIVREYAEKYASKAPFIQWEHDGHLEFCETSIDFRQIEAVVKELVEAHYVREFRHDPAYANEMAQRIEENHGVLAVPFRQTIMQYAKPVDDFEAMVIDGSLHHDGHPVYGWEIGHALVKADPNNNRRIVKPTDDDFRKVDIIQAGIMSLSGAVAAESDKSVYESRGVMYAGE
jgi:phage terminase large subunit-like protein